MYAAPHDAGLTSLEPAEHNLGSAQLYREQHVETPTPRPIGPSSTEVEEDVSQLTEVNELLGSKGDEAGASRDENMELQNSRFVPSVKIPKS